MNFTLYAARTTGMENNSYYPDKHSIRSPQDLSKAIAYDHVCATYKNGHRSTQDFLSSDCTPMDNDNSHSDRPEDWIYPEDYEIIFPDVSYVVAPSRHNNTPKGRSDPRPRHHIYFPHATISDPLAYKRIKETLSARYPFFDNNALDAARFIYGHATEDIIWHPGTQTIDELLADQSFVQLDAKRLEIPEGSRNSRLSHFAGRILKRLGNTAEARQQFLKEADKCNPPLEDVELKRIWHSATSFANRIAQQEGYIPPDQYGTNEKQQALTWEPPVPFSNYDVPGFPVDALPPALANYAKAVSESTQTPIDMSAVCGLATISAAMQGKYQVQGKADWFEPVNCYWLVIMEPSERKSAVQKAHVLPLNLFEEKQNKIDAATIETSRMRKRILERRQRTIEEQASKGKADPEEVERIAAEIANFREIKPLKLYVDDITTEKLTSVMAKNDGRAAILSTEGGIFDNLAGSYSRNVNIDVMLKAYSGDAIRVDRIGRESETVMNPALTMLLMVQPAVLTGLMQNNVFRGRGLTARFLYSMPKSKMGSRQYRANSVPQDVYNAYERLIFNVLEDSVEREAEVITLSPEADQLLGTYADLLEPKLVAEYQDIKDWVGKLVGNILRISGLLCRATTYRSHEFLERPVPLVVDGPTMQNAIRIGEYFIRHAMAAFMMMGVNMVDKQSRRVLEKINEQGLTEFSKRDIMRLCRGLRCADDVQQILDLLTDYGYIQELPSAEYCGRGRKPGVKYAVNPGADSE